MSENSVIVNKISTFMHNKKEHISASWMKNELMVEIFNHHKVSRKKFHEYFGQQIITYFADVLINKQKIGHCPVMNKFIDYMIERNISVKEIFLICMEFRRSMISELLKVKLISPDNLETIDMLSYIFNQNLAGVLEYYQNKCLNTSEIKNEAVDLSEYELEFQSFLEQQENPAITLSKKNLIHANSAFLDLINVKNIEEFNNKYKSPWDIFDSFEFLDQKFKNKNYSQWLEEVLSNKESVNKVFISQDINKESIAYRVLVSETPCKICEESNKYMMTFYPVIQGEEITSENYIDDLTNVPNKLKFDLVLESSLSEYQTSKEPVSIIVAKIKDLEHINQIYGTEMGDVVLQEFADQVVNSFGELGFFARIDGDTFALISKDSSKSSVNLYANSILGLGRSIVFDETIDLHPKFSLAIVSFVEGDTKSSVEERIQNLIKDVDEHGSDHIKDDTEILEKEIQRVQEQKLFLKECHTLYMTKAALNTTNFYKELPMESKAKIMEVNKKTILLSLRSIAVHSLQLGNEVYIRRDNPQKDVRCKVLHIDKVKNLIEIGDFDFLTSSPLNRKNLHVQVEKHIPVTLIHDKKHQVAYLKSISVDTVKLVLPTICSFSLNLEIILDIILEWNGVKKSLSIPVEVIKVGKESAGVFNVIFKLLAAPKQEEILQSFVSHRQREIVQELHALDT
ncbi:GGDEF domain-containing protein [bacterium]|nr:GGDEF domain-containing protein [bacterium]